MRQTMKGIGAVLLLTIGSANANTVSLGGELVEPSLGLTVLQFDLMTAGTVTGITFDFTYISAAPSWSEELTMQITHEPTGQSIQIGAFAPTFAAGADYCDDLFGSTCDADFGGLATSDPLIVSAFTVPLAVANGMGLWTIQIGEGFDDAPMPDGFFQDGSELVINQTVVPIPAAAWLFGSALLGLAGLRRRR